MVLHESTVKNKLQILEFVKAILESSEKANGDWIKY